MFTDPLLWLADIGIFAGLWILGVLVVRALIPGSRLPEQLSLGYGLGIGILTWLLFLLSWAGIPLNLATILTAFFILVAACILTQLVSRRRMAPAPEPRPEAATRLQRSIDIVGWVLLAAYGLLLLYLSTGLSYYLWDALAIWSVKGYGIGLEHSILAAKHWGAWGITYPLNVPLAISIFFSADQDLLPGSKLLFPGFLVAILIALRELFRRRNVSPWFAWCAVFAVGTIPLLVQYSLIGYANVPFAYYFAVGGIWAGLGVAARDPGRTLAGGLLLALSIWTRIEGLEFWFIAFLGLAVMWGKNVFARQSLLRIGLPALVIAASWILFRRFNGAAPGEEAILVDALKRILHGELHLLAIYQIIRFTGYLVIKTQVYGLLIPLVIGVSLPLAIFSKRIRRDGVAMFILVSGLLAGAGVLLMYYLTSYDQIMGLDLLTWLGTGYDRMLLGPVVLLAAASILILWKVLIALWKD